MNRQAPPHLPPSPVPPLLLPRGLIFLASIWLIGSWIIAIGVRPPVQPSSATYTPAVRLMLLCVSSGLMIGWPLLRLSQERPAYPVRQTALDLMVLLGLMQVVVWPLRLVTSWTPMRTAAIDATLSGWVILAGAVIAGAIGSRDRGPRNLAMAACVGMCFLGPALAWLGVLVGVDAMRLMELSPFIAVQHLGDAGGTQPTASAWGWMGALWACAASAWIALGLTMARCHRSPDPLEPS
ncbi:MAG: hypothetical protein L0Y44_16130 [Phycisphaerales bacterium]|nr:hypothetical protein [Phycisphaerales bacterium]MCI0632171.1 hypothetical protein [Phycisphaerales bacterium]MCI0677142.1 hypothetical protein [Phycisphaerales bacterium]